MMLLRFRASLNQNVKLFKKNYFMKHIDEHYKGWCGEHHTVNSCHAVHDSAEACDFAEYYHKEKSEPLKTMLNKILSIENRAFGLKGFDVDRLKSEIRQSLQDAF